MDRPGVADSRRGLGSVDAKLASFTGLINECPNGDSRWTQYFPNIDRKLWKGV